MTRKSSNTAAKKFRPLSGRRDYSPYLAYKDSDIEWLGEIPEHWEVKRLKYSATINDETLPETTDLGFVMSYVDISGVDLHRGIVSSVEMTFEDAPSRARRIVRDGDTIVSTVRTYLGAITPIRNPVPNTIVSTGFAVIRPHEIFSDFMSYLLREPSLVGEIVSRSLGVSYPAVNASEIGTLPILLPDLDEQRDIAAFLDLETEKIDMLVEKQERLIDLLQERRSALISHTVTKGLDPNILMKDSGIEWLGEIPEHWSIRRLGSSIDRCINGIWGDEPDGHNDLICVRVADFDRANMRVLLESRTFRSVAPNDRNNRLLNKGDLLLEKSGGGDLQPVGAVVLYEHDFVAVCSNFIGRMVVSVGFDPYYLTYLHSCVYAMRLNVRSIKQTTGIQNLDVDSYLTEHVAFPPLAEQTAIATFLDRETAKIDDLIAKIHQVIKLRKELRSALISAAVTGKIDVRQTSASTA